MAPLIDTINPIVRPSNLYSDNCLQHHYEPKRAGELLNTHAKLDACSESETHESNLTNFSIAARSEYPLMAARQPDVPEHMPSTSQLPMPQRPAPGRAPRRCKTCA